VGGGRQICGKKIIKGVFFSLGGQKHGGDFEKKKNFLQKTFWVSRKNFSEKFFFFLKKPPPPFKK
jgi:hypothetical protein